MAKKINLDALIPREDFDIQDIDNPGIGRNITTLSVSDFSQDSFFFSTIRKPDFQRETNEWDAEKISDLIESFLASDLIPALILWRSAGSLIFVIDGSHRISALAAWVNNDYGDGSISKQFYDGIIPEDQLKIAEETRNFIKKRIGSFEDYKLALKHPDRVKSEIAEKAKRLGSLAIQLQWVEGDSSKAEASFFKINQQAVPIDNTELRLLKSRRKPNAIAARAIMRSGKGHKYWSRFSVDNQEKIQNLAHEIFELLFMPKLVTPIKTLDVPIGGKIISNQRLALILDFVNITNKGTTEPDESLTNDQDGFETIKFLIQAKKIAERINSNHPGSLGLHPLVYFYAQNGQYKIASFFAITSLIIELEKRNLFKKFTDVRDKFEHLLIEYDYLIQQIVRKYRSSSKGYEYIKTFFLLSIQKLSEGKNVNTAIEEIMADTQFNYLTKLADNPSIDLITTKDFSNETKSATFIKTALASGLRCKICNGYLHSRSISIDHIVRRQDGGLGSPDNAQLTHPYCNSTVKN